MVPKCLGTEVSWSRSVLLPFYSESSLCKLSLQFFDTVGWVTARQEGHPAFRKFRAGSNPKVLLETVGEPDLTWSDIRK